MSAYPRESLYRMANWPEIGDGELEFVRIFDWLKDVHGMHHVHLTQDRFVGRLGIQEWLVARYGPQMIARYGFEHKPHAQLYYWTEGRWLSIVNIKKQTPWGRNYLFEREDEAFEFKMQWG